MQINNFYVKNIESFLFQERARRDALKVAFISTLVFFILGNGYAYFNSYPLHDAILFETYNSYEWQISLGRFLLPVYMMIRGAVPIQPIIFALSALFLSVSVCIVIFLLWIKTRIESILICAFLSINVFTLEISVVHQYFSDVFMLSLLFASLGVFCLRKTTIRNLLISFICLFVSFGIYPAFITYAFCLLILMFIRELIDGNSKHLMRRIIIRFIPFVLAGGWYLVVSRIVLNILGVVPAKVSWSMFSDRSYSIRELVKSATTQYSDFADLFFKGEFFGNLAGFATIILTVVSLFMFLKKESNRMLLLLVILFLILFPLCSRMVNVMTKQGGAFRTMYAQFLFLPMMVWVFFVGIRNECVKKESRKNSLIATVTILSCYLICCNIHYTNMGISYQKALYHRTAFHMSRAINDMLDYTKGNTDVPIRIVGVFHLTPDNYNDYQNIKKVEGLSMDTGITYESVFNAYARTVGYNLNLNCTSPGVMKDGSSVKAMPSYPKSGYIAYVDNCLVIKLSQ